MDTNRSIRSMTGYGRAQCNQNGREITIEIRSVNHRFFEYSTRIPRTYAFLEEKIKSIVKDAASRGKIDVTLTSISTDARDTQVKIDYNLAKKYVEALKEFSESFQIRNDIAVSQLLNLPELFIVSKVAENEEDVWSLVEQAVNEACRNFVAMREAEGKKMELDLLSRLDKIEGLVKEVNDISPTTVENYRAKLFARLQEILKDTTITEQRVLAEASIFAEKIAVAEETVRLESHIHQFRDILKLGGAIGRKLDFLIQEFNREANTIGSKAQDIEMSKVVVELKSEIEKMREQVQNIE